jgi:hypothetical protein
VVAAAAGAGGCTAWHAFVLTQRWGLYRTHGSVPLTSSSTVRCISLHSYLHAAFNTCAQQRCNASSRANSSRCSSRDVESGKRSFAWEVGADLLPAVGCEQQQQQQWQYMAAGVVGSRMFTKSCTCALCCCDLGFGETAIWWRGACERVQLCFWRVVLGCIAYKVLQVFCWGQLVCNNSSSMWQGLRGIRCWPICSITMLCCGAACIQTAGLLSACTAGVCGGLSVYARPCRYLDTWVACTCLSWGCVYISARPGVILVCVCTMDLHTLVC